jgi:membrane fusion protein, multidrug efflux system
MQKKWIAAGVLAVLAVGGLVAMQGGWLGTSPSPGGAQASAQPTQGDQAGGAGKPADKPLSFVASEVTQPLPARMSRTVAFSGPLVAPQTAVLRAKAGGTLLALSVAEGSRVAAGQLVGRVDLAELTSRVAERSALLESARATLLQAERQHASNERLAAQQFISANALDGSRGALDTARAQVAAAQASLDSTRVGLREATLLAPIAGIVAKRHVLPGEKVSPEQAVLTIVDLKTLELAARVGTHEVASLAPGLPVQVRVEGVDEPIAGRVARIAPAAEPGTRSIGVTIELANPGERLRAGQYAVAEAQQLDATERLTLPVEAVVGSAGQEHVWLIENGQLARRAVTLGRRDEREGRVEVLQGLDAASQVLAARFDNLREGAKALIAADKTGEPSAPVASAAASAPLRR